MTNPTLSSDQQKAIDEFNVIRKALLVPFDADLRTLPGRELPEGRRWQRRCQGNRSHVIFFAPQPEEKSTPGKKS